MELICYKKFPPGQVSRQRECGSDEPNAFVCKGIIESNRIYCGLITAVQPPLRAIRTGTVVLLLTCEMLRR